MSQTDIDTSSLEFTVDGKVIMTFQEFIPYLHARISLSARLQDFSHLTNKLLSEEEALKVLDIVPSHLAMLRNDKKVIAVAAGRKHFYLKSSLDRYLAEELERRCTL